MRIIYDAYGQMGNRLWQYLDQIAWAIKCGKRVVSLFWDPSLRDFYNLRHNRHISFPFYFKALDRGKLGNFYQRILFKLLGNDTIQNTFASSVFKKMGFVSGKDIMFADQHYHDVWSQEKPLFAPSRDIVERIDAEFLHARQAKQCKIVGVHFRKGDYKEYYDGFFYYEDDEYRDFMRQMVRLLGEDTYFFIASNETIDEEFFREFNLMGNRNTKAVEDMYALSKCDYVMGPFSTFSGWASFFGDVPYYYFKRKDTVALSDFHVIQRMTHPSVQA